MLEIVAMLAGSNVLAAIVGALVSLRVSKRTGDREEVDAVVDRYREQAAEERAQKESAVSTVQKLLALAEQQIVSLKDTITHLTATIEAMAMAGDSQQATITALTAEIERLRGEQATMEAEVARLRIQADSGAATLAESYPSEQITAMRGTMEP